MELKIVRETTYTIGKVKFQETGDNVKITTSGHGQRYEESRSVTISKAVLLAFIEALEGSDEVEESDVQY